MKSLMNGKAPGKKHAGTRNRFRIIGGEWRGRRLRFPAERRIRPTPDRVRETLFNWLQNHIAGARCLDLFAGSGALGLEALSRGAAQAVFVERDPVNASMIREHLGQLGACARVECVDAFDFLRTNTDTFDLAFLDPPFDQALLKSVLPALAEHGTLKSDALVYVEAAAGKLASSLPAGWALRRASKAGAVEFGLAETEAHKDANDKAE